MDLWTIFWQFSPMCGVQKRVSVVHYLIRWLIVCNYTCFMSSVKKPKHTIWVFFAKLAAQKIQSGIKNLTVQLTTWGPSTEKKMIQYISSVYIKSKLRLSIYKKTVKLLNPLNLDFFLDFSDGLPSTLCFYLLLITHKHTGTAFKT